MHCWCSCVMILFSVTVFPQISVGVKSKRPAACRCSNHIVRKMPFGRTLNCSKLVNPIDVNLDNLNNPHDMIDSVLPSKFFIISCIWDNIMSPFNDMSFNFYISTTKNASHNINEFMSVYFKFECDV